MSESIGPTPGCADADWAMLVPALRRLIDEAAEIRDGLDRSRDRADGRAKAADEASMRFQSRLRVGVSLLHGFESQIARLERIMAEADALRRVETRQRELDERLARIEAHLGTRRVADRGAPKTLVIETKLIAKPMARLSYHRRRLRS